MPIGGQRHSEQNMKNSRMLRTIGLSLAFMTTTVIVMAQDVIIRRDGDEIQAKVIRVGAAEIDYKKWSNQDGPTYSVNKSEVFIIKYGNGEKDVFKDDPTVATNNPQETEPMQPVGELAKSSAENEAYISSINNLQLPSMPEEIKKKNKSARTYYIVLGVNSNSVMETDDIKAELRMVKTFHDLGYGYSYDVGIYCVLKNKTGSVIYVDRALSAVGNNSYYNPDVITETTANGENKSSGIGVNLGGVASALGVGGVVGGVASAINVNGGHGNQSGTLTTRTLSSERFSIIPAMSTIELKREALEEETTSSAWSMSLKKTGKHVKTQLYEEINLISARTTIGNMNIYNEKNSFAKRRFVISYSTDPNFATYKTLVFDVYVRAVYGLPLLQKTPQNAIGHFETSLNGTLGITSLFF